MALSEGVQGKLDQEGITEDSARLFFEELKVKGAVRQDVNFDDPGVQEATILYLLNSSLTEGGRLDQLDEVGLNSLAIVRQISEITGAGEIFAALFRRE